MAVAAGLAAAGLGTAVLVCLGEDGGRTPPSAASPGVAPSSASPRGATATPATAASAPAGTAGADAPASAPTPWPDVPVAARISDLGPLARPVHDGLQRARADLQRCFADAERAEAERARVPAQPDEDSWGAAVLLLELESRDGEVVVVGAPLQNLGDSSPELADCCEGVLRGLRIAAPGATPGRRFRLPFQLTR